MAAALGLPLLAILLGQATADVELGARLEARATTVDGAGQPRVTQAAYAVTPGALLLVRRAELRFTLGYAPRFWSTDLAGSPEPVVNHRVGAALEVGSEGRWRAVASAAGERGWTDPLADLRSASVVTSQLPSTQALHFEDLNTALRGEGSFDERTRGEAGGAWTVSRAVDPLQRGTLPTQRTLSFSGSLLRDLTEHDTLVLGLGGQRIQTGEAGSELIGKYADASVDWDHTLTAELKGRLGAGAALVWPEAPGDPYRGLPSASGRLTWEGDPRASGDLGARLTTFVDRFSGQVSSMLEVGATLGWTLGERLSLTAQAAGGARTDGETRLAGAELRLTWLLREALALDAGARAWRQLERRPEIPSITEAGAFVALVFGTGGSVSGRGGAGPGFRVLDGGSGAGAPP